MISDKFNLTNAQSQYAVANTPLFLVRKLQEDPVVKTISDTLTGVEILRELEQAVSHRPDNLLQAVLPYVCLVALWMKPDAAFLRGATKIKPVQNDEWFKIVRQALIQTYRPTARQLISVPMMTTPKAQIRSNSASSVTTIRLSEIAR
jgi:hypothetical protein